MAALILKNLCKSYGDKQVVNDLSLEIQEGEIFGLLGPNGAGKSTTINMISGVTRVEQGSISIFGHDNQKDYRLTRRLAGVMHQEIVVDTFFPIYKGLQIHAGYYGVADDPKWRELLVDRLALGPHLEKPMMKLSGGMKRRYMVAKALVHKPRLLILDEPTAGVDVELRATLWDFVREMNRDQGTTVLLTTHYLEEAQEMCGRVGIMNFGKLIALDKTRSLLEKMDERRLILRLASPLSDLPAGLEAFQPSLADEGHTVALRMKSGSNPTELLSVVAGLGLQIKDLETRSPNLQEAFLKLTSAKGDAPRA